MVDKNQTTVPVPPAVRKLLLEAWNTQLWIYDQLGQKWYTPEEFKAQFTTLVTPHNIHRYVIKDPKVGIKESLENVQAALEGVEDLRLKIEAYYEVRLERK